MATRVVSISRTLAAGGEQISEQVADQLGFRYIDDEIISRAAEKEGVSPDTVEKVEHSRSLILRIVEGMSSPGSDMGYFPSVSSDEPISQSPDFYQRVISEVIHETAAQGEVVIVAHGASIPLANMDGLLRVFITASPTVRVERHMSEANVDERQAKRAIEHSDRERQNYFRRFYDLRQELPTHYDLVVNTDRIEVAEAAKVIVMAAQR